MEQVVKNPRQLYEIRSDIINIIKGIEKKLINLLDKTDFEHLKKEPKLINAVKNLKAFSRNIISGEIDNIKDAEEEYLKKMLSTKIG